jgi:hypothetical protein
MPHDVARFSDNRRRESLQLWKGVFKLLNNLSTRVNLQFLSLGCGCLPNCPIEIRYVCLRNLKGNLNDLLDVILSASWQLLVEDR